jgi:hypothetical protein
MEMGIRGVGRPKDRKTESPEVYSEWFIVHGKKRPYTIEKRTRTNKLAKLYAPLKGPPG